MRSATAQALVTRPSEQDLKNALSNSVTTGHNHVSNSTRTEQSRAKPSPDTFNNSSLHHHGHYRENADKCDVVEGPWNLNNPVKASRSHQELHKELLLTHKNFVLWFFGRDRGLVVCCKSELQVVLERRKREQTQKEEGEQSRSPLEQVLLKRQQKHQEMMTEKEEEQKVQEEVQLMEFVRVRQNLKKVHSALHKNIHP